MMMQSFQYPISLRKDVPVQTQTTNSKAQSTRTSVFVVFIALSALLYVHEVVMVLYALVSTPRTFKLCSLTHWSTGIRSCRAPRVAWAAPRIAAAEGTKHAPDNHCA